MSILFAPVSIKNILIRNRFVRSATYDGLADHNGHVSDRQLKLFSDLADGGVGLIIAGITYVHHTGQISPFQNSITGDEYISGLKRLTKAVHDRGAKIAIQIFHGGREAKYLRTQNTLPLAPSVIENDSYYKGEYRAATDSEIWEIIQAFGDGARRAKEAGFDAVQVHGAHAYLLSQFLSPYTNRRQDQWGGDLKNRLRIHCEIYKDIRKKVGEDYPVFIKIGVQDGFPGGLEFNEGKQAAGLLAGMGYDSLEISQGLRGERYEGMEFRANINGPGREAYYRHWCREIKSRTDIPVMMVGGLRTLSLMKEIVQNKEADLISLCRPLICEPDLINHWRINEQKKAKCVSCNKCVDEIYKGRPVSCVQTAGKNDPE